MKKVLFYAFLLSLPLCSGCLGCKDDCRAGALTFDLPLQAYGIKDTLNIGDTLRIRLDVPDQMPERYSGYMYDFVDYNFMLVTYLVRLDTITEYPDSKEYSDWVTTKGESKYFDGLYLVLPDYEDHKYQYELLIIAKQKGLFVFGMNSDAYRLRPLEKLEGPCSGHGVAARMKLINDTNVNFEFLKNSPDEVQANTPRQRFDEHAGFCFYVK